jgi:4-hydroxybenzoate polyprenyltransferase
MFLTTTMGDLRDIEGDKENKVRTLPVVFGVKAVVTNLQIYTIVNYSVLIMGIIFNILPADAILGVYGGYLLLRYIRTPAVLSRQKGTKKSLARFSWVTSIGLIVGRVVGITVGIIL